MSDTAAPRSLAVIRIWAALAWADDVMQESERTAISKLISVAQLTEEERSLARSYLESKVELNTEPISGLSAAAREGVYRAALRLAMVDLEMAQEETAMLQRLREGLSIDDEAAARIEKDLAAS